MPQVTEDNFDDPNLLDFDLLLQNMKELQAGSPTQTPVYSFHHSKRTGFVTTPVPSNKVLVVEGTYALKEMLRPVYDISISVTGEPPLRPHHFSNLSCDRTCDREPLHVRPTQCPSSAFRRRALRSCEARAQRHHSRCRPRLLMIMKHCAHGNLQVGQNPSDVINQITDTVFPMYKAFIEPDLAFATIRIQNTFNPFQVRRHVHARTYVATHFAFACIAVMVFFCVFAFETLRRVLKTLSTF